VTIEQIERKQRRREQVWQGDSESSAAIVAGRLEAEGIQARVLGHTTPYRSTAFGLGGAWGITVPAGKAERARTVLREFDEGHNIIDEETETGLPGAQRSTLYAGLVFLMGLVAVGLFLAILDRT